MMIFRLAGWVVFGIIFLAIALFSTNALVRWRTKNDFMVDVRKLVNIIDILAHQPVGSSDILEIHIPQNCFLYTEPQKIVAQVWGENISFKSELELPTLTLGPGDYQIYVMKTNSGVDIIVR